MSVSLDIASNAGIDGAAVWLAATALGVDATVTVRAAGDDVPLTSLTLADGTVVQQPVAIGQALAAVAGRSSGAQVDEWLAFYGSQLSTLASGGADTNPVVDEAAPTLAQVASPVSEEHATALDSRLLSCAFVGDTADVSVADVFIYAACVPVLAATAPKLAKSHPNLCRWFRTVQTAVLGDGSSAHPSGTPFVSFKPARTTLFDTLADLSSGAAAAAPAGKGKQGKGGKQQGKGGKQQGKGGKQQGKGGKQGKGGDGGDGGKKKEKKNKKKESKKAAKMQMPLVCRVKLVVGEIVSCEPHPNSDKMYVSQINLGEESGPRTIVSGLAAHVDIADMKGLCVVVVNVKPVELDGVESNGLALAVTSSDKSRKALLRAPDGSSAGDTVEFVHLEVGSLAQHEPDAAISKKHLSKIFSKLKSTDSGKVMFGSEVELRVPQGELVADIAGGTIR